MPEMQVNPEEASMLLRAVDQKLSIKREVVGSRSMEGRHNHHIHHHQQSHLNNHGKHYTDPHIQLQDKELWSKFKEHTNEMIVTKSGR